MIDPLNFAVGLFGVFFIGLGTTGVLSPPYLFAALSWWHAGARLYLAAAARVVLGCVLVLGAAGSRAPLGLQMFGAGALLAGLATPLFGARRFEALLRRWRAAPRARARLGGCGVALIGASLLWAAFPPG